MDTNNGSDSTSQRYMQGSSSSTSANAKAPETTVSSNIRPVLNYSIQTGEEFALEFMRERVIPKKPSVPSTSGDQNTATSYMELRGVLGISHTGSETGSDVSMLPTVDKGHFKETGNRSKYASSRSGPRISSGDGSSRGASHGYYSSGASDVVSKKMKFLCSFGGKILPRPSDGKLRYVGGDTRIIRIIKDITWQELTQKTMKIYNQPHNLKYQLPGEDLDALISVSCEEDLQNMMEECSVLESGEGSQKLRLFLFPSGDFDDMNLNLGSIDGDSEIQYVVAVNGMDLGSRRTSGHGIANTSGNELDQLLNLHVEVDGANSSRVATESNEIHTGPLAGNMVGPTTSPLLTHLSSDYYPHLHSYQDYQMQLPEGEYYPYSAIQHPGSAHNLDGRISIPSSVPSDYNYTSQYAPVEGTAVLPQQELFSLHHGLTEGLYVGTQTRDPEVQMEETLTVDSLAHQKDEEECSRALENEVTAPRQQLADLGPNHMQAEVLSHKGNHLELALGTLPVNAAYPGESGGLNEDDHYTSGGAFISGFSDYEADVTDLSYNDPPSHSSRVFRSERIPRTQAEILNRLSKSDDSIGSQYLILQSRSGMGHESIAEAIDHSYEGSIVSQAENASISAKPPVLNPATLEDGLMQFEKYKVLANAITQTNQLEETSIKPESETAKAPRPPARGNEPLTGGSKRNPEEAVVNPMSCATYDQTDVITDGQSNKSGRKIQKSELIHPTMIPAADEDTVKEEEFYHESNMSSHTEKSVYVGETGIDKSNVIKSPVDGSDITKDASGSAGIGAATMVHENPYSNLPEINWADITREDSSLPTKGREDILVDINDRFPHNLISDLFSRARLTEDSQNVTLPRDDTGLSLNTQNLEPQRWSFFRNLAQDDFTRKDVSLMDQDHIDYSTLLKKVEEGIPNPYEVTRLVSEGVDLSHMDSGVEFEEEIQKESSGTNEDTVLDPDYILPHANLLDQSGQRLQVENPYSRVGEKLITHVMETEDLKFGIGEVGGSVLDASVVDSDFSHLQIIKNDDLEELKELGSGTFGTVYHGKWRGTDVAIKRIKKSCFTGRSSEQERLTSEFWREAGILSSLHHPNVVAFYGVVQDGPGATLATVAEFMVNGSLRHVLQRKDRAERYLDRRKRLIIAMDAAFGMEYLHSKNIVHFDLKCDNLLVNLKDQTRPICKVGDFGLSKIKQNTLVSGGVRGTLPWMAPELLNGGSNKVSEKVDVFSFGIVMWEILTGEEPYANMHYGAIIGGIVNNTLRPPVPASCDPEWRRLMEQCWAPDPAQRPSFTQIASRLRAMSVASQTKAGQRTSTYIVEPQTGEDGAGLEHEDPIPMYIGSCWSRDWHVYGCCNS